MAGKNGGARPGAGRKKGGSNQKTREIADRAAKEGITPLEVMIKAMRDAYENEGAAAAHVYAKDAAPYMHPRVGSIDVAVSGPGGAPIATTNVSMDDFIKAARALKDEF